MRNLEERGKRQMRPLVTSLTNLYARATNVARAKDGAEKPHYDTRLSST